MSKTFYADLSSFKQFEDFVDNSHYQSIPEDWVVFISDIKGSTKAIENGLYKEVNLVGAASITLSIQATEGLEFPFVFGGDGASLCVPETEQAKVGEALSKLINLAKNNFDLELRVAKIPVSVIYKAGKKLLLAKLEITEGSFISLFRGGGLAYADVLAKQSYDEFRVPPSNEEVDSLEGLSCRWSPIPAKKGLIVSLLVVAKDDTAVDVYRDVLNKIRTALNSNIEDANPIALEQVRYKSFVQTVKDEVKFHGSGFSFSFIKRLLGAIFPILIYRHGINLWFFNAKKYSDSIGAHSDYRKFDDTLRLIIDCGENEFLNLQKTLEAAYRNNKIYYGLFTSSKVLMTCFVESTSQGKHLHFVDGGDGGLAMAAKQLKAQLKGENATKT